MAETESSIRPQTNRKHLWLMAAMLAMLALMLLPIDRWIATQMRAIDVPGDVRRGLGLCEAFAHSFGVVLILGCIFASNPRLGRSLGRVLACALVPGVLVNLVKLFVVRWRPIAFDDLPATVWSSWIGVGTRFTDVPLDNYLTQSFPSGHAATAVGFAVGLCWLFPRGKPAFITLAVLASLQRVMSDAHWASDTLVGAAIAVAVGGWLLGDTRVGRWLSRWERRSPSRDSADHNLASARRAA